VARDIDDVVGAAHHEDIAVLVLVAGIGGFVVAGKFVEIGLPAALVLLHKVGRQPGGIGSLITIEPMVPAATGLADSSTTST